MRKYILNGTDFTYTPFVEKNMRQGQSGKLLIGASDDMKLMVKHVFPADAANEFVASYIAEQLGFNNPKAYLLTHAPAFASRYAVGLEYMDLTPIDLSTLTDAQRTDFIHQVSLNGLIFQEDKIQLEMWGNHIVSYDFSIAFAQEQRFGFLHNCFNRYYYGIMFCPNVAQHMMNLPDEAFPAIERIYYDGLRPVLTMDCAPLFDTLSSYFPKDIAEYYIACVDEMQTQVKARLDEYDNKNSRGEEQ